jgi:hypothetical protein
LSAALFPKSALAFAWSIQSSDTQWPSPISICPGSWMVSSVACMICKVTCPVRPCHFLFSLSLVSLDSEGNKEFFPFFSRSFPVTFETMAAAYKTLYRQFNQIYAHTRTYSVLSVVHLTRTHLMERSQTALLCIRVCHTHYWLVMKQGTS